MIWRDAVPVPSVTCPDGPGRGTERNATRMTSLTGEIGFCNRRARSVHIRTNRLPGCDQRGRRASSDCVTKSTSRDGDCRGENVEKRRGSVAVFRENRSVADAFFPQTLWLLIPAAAACGVLTAVSSIFVALYPGRDRLWRTGDGAHGGLVRGFGSFRLGSTATKYVSRAARPTPREPVPC